MKTTLRNAISQLKIFFDRIDSALSSTAIFLMFIFTFILISFSITQITTDLGHPSSIFKNASDWILNASGINTKGVTDVKYASILGSITSVIAVIVTIYFSILTALSHRKNKIKLTKESIIKKFDTPNDGVDDLRIMLDYYKKAEHLTIFAGDYNWLESNAELKLTILSLAKSKKIKLVSHKNKEIVEKSIDKQTFELLKNDFTFDSKFNKKCSVIRAAQESVLLYKFDTSIREDGKKSIYVIHEVIDTKYLLDVIGKFAEAI